MKKISFLLLLMLLIYACQRTDEDAITPDQIAPDDVELQELDLLAKQHLSGTDLESYQTTIENGFDRLRGIPIPVYAKVEGGWGPYGMPYTEDWVFFYFYVRHPQKIPDDFNLLQFFDPRALELKISEWAVDGWAWWLPSPTPPQPHTTVLRERKHVPVWFFTHSQAEEFIKDGIITIPELEALKPIKGYATNFFEFLQPYLGGSPEPKLRTWARGRFETGQRFAFSVKVDVVGTGLDTKTHLWIY